MGGQAAIDRAHSRGSLTAPERLDLLLDPGSQVPFGRLFHSSDLSQADVTYGEGELDGFGTIGGRWVAYFASDPRVKGASGGPADFRHAETFRNVVEKAALPLIYLMQGGGARIDEAMSSKFVAFPATGMGARKVFPRRGLFLTAVLGSYYAPWNVAQADFSVMTESSNLSLTAPPLVFVGTGQNVTADELGGAQVQARISGQIDAVVPDEVAALDMIRTIFEYLPSRAGAASPIVDRGDPPERSCPDLYDIVPPALNQAYDIRRVIRSIVDHDSFIEFAAQFARNMVTGLARMNGRTVLIMANQPMFLAGVIDAAAVVKLKKVLGLSHDFDIPLVSLVDTPGVLPTKEQEHQAVMTSLYEHGMRRLRSRAPKVTVVLRKGVGFAIGAMSGGDPEGMTFAWPDSQICFTGVEACVRVVHRREIEESGDPSALLSELSARYTGSSSPWAAARVGYLDDVIDPSETRVRVIRALEVSRRHGRAGRGVPA